MKSPTFQRFAYRTSKSVKDMVKQTGVKDITSEANLKAAEHKAKGIAADSSVFLRTLKEELAKDASKVSKAVGKGGKR